MKKRRLKIQSKENKTLPSRYWEPGIEETGMSNREITEAENWIMENGIPYDEELPFN